MEPFFPGPDVERLPPEKTRLLELRATPDPDGKRIKVYLKLTPFEKRPYIELNLDDLAGNNVSTASIIEPMAWKLELTLHIRKPVSPLPAADPGGTIESNTAEKASYTLMASLSYPDLGEIDRRKITIEPSQP